MPHILIQKTGDRIPLSVITGPNSKIQSSIINTQFLSLCAVPSALCLTPPLDIPNLGYLTRQKNLFDPKSAIELIAPGTPGF
jgi:hypothetical protein